ncbi:hypothetical protein PTKIN_Ptkin09bG0256800 [Pterospermum kingtungense]
MEESQNFGHQHPLVLLSEEHMSRVGDCSRCGEKVSAPSFSCLDCGFYLHKQCAEAPSEINHPFHPDHAFILLQNPPYSCICDFCNKTCQRFVYHCSCKLDFHIKCALFTYDIAEKKLKELQHVALKDPLISPGNNGGQLQKLAKCFACWEPLANYAYFSPDCGFNLHKKCADLPLKINELGHKHPLALQFNSKRLSCEICQKTPQEGLVYCCPPCNSVVHIECVPPPFVEDKSHQHAFTLFRRRVPFICDACGDESSYFVVSPENEDKKSSDSLELSSITCVFERNDAGEATKIKHFKHIHNLLLSDEIMEHDQSCDGCMLPISNSFYSCSELECDFLLHKACAELPKMKHVWHHDCREPVILTSDEIFICEICCYPSSGFSYECHECEEQTCLRFVIALTSGAQICQGHEHPLLYYKGYQGKCSACGEVREGTFRCKGCDFALDYKCFSLPTRARHKCDEHLLALTYHDAYSYSECDYCDICEEKRDPNHWFYHCATCDTSAHIKCVLGRYPYLKLGGIYEINKVHPHPLTYVKKIYYYPDCDKCGEPCQDFALECGSLDANILCICHVRNHQMIILKVVPFPLDSRIEWSGGIAGFNTSKLLLRFSGKHASKTQSLVLCKVCPNASFQFLV